MSSFDSAGQDPHWSFAPRQLAQCWRRRCWVDVQQPTTGRDIQNSILCYLAVLTTGILGVHSLIMYYLFTSLPQKQTFFRSTGSILFESPFTLPNDEAILKPQNWHIGQAVSGNDYSRSSLAESKTTTSSGCHYSSLSLSVMLFAVFIKETASV